MRRRCDDRGRHYRRQTVLTARVPVRCCEKEKAAMAELRQQELVRSALNPLRAPRGRSGLVSVVLARLAWELGPVQVFSIQ